MNAMAPAGAEREERDDTAMGPEGGEHEKKHDKKDEKDEKKGSYAMAPGGAKEDKKPVADLLFTLSADMVSACLILHVRSPQFLKCQVYRSLPLVCVSLQASAGLTLVSIFAGHFHLCKHTGAHQRQLCDYLLWKG